MNKIFVIGFNKTATTTFHNIFLKNNLKSQHSNKWNLQKFDCFSDNIEMNDNFKILYNKYPDADFILNTRTLKKWIISRFKHGNAIAIKNKKFKKNWAWPPTEELVKKWIIERETYYSDVLNFFKDKPNKLLIINIDQPNWEEFLYSHFNFQIKNIDPQNIRQNTDKINYMINIIGKTFKKLKYTQNMKNRILLLNNHNYLHIYKNNIFKNDNIENHDLENHDLENNDIGNNDVENNDVENDDGENNNVENNNVGNDDVENDNIENNDVENNNVGNDVENNDVENNNVGNDDVENNDVENILRL